MKATFLDCAPKALIESLEVRRELVKKENSTLQEKIVQYMLEHSTNIESCSEEQKREIQARYHDGFLLFPLEEQIEILEKLLNDNEMKIAWTNLSKIVEDDYEYNQFWHTCMEAVTEGRRSNQRSSAGHKKHFQKIKDCASELSKLLEETNEMVCFPVSGLISENRIERLRNKLKTPPDVPSQHVRSYLNSVIPNIHAVLYNVAEKAEEISKKTPLVRKPKSFNAAIHYFVRHLSGYLLNQYGKPLHVVVASTAYVIFKDPSINADNVRKIVKS